MGEQFQSWVEGIVQSRLDQELKLQVEEHTQEILDNFHDDFQRNTEAFEEKIKTKLKNEKEEILQQTDEAFQKFEQKITVKLEEIVEKKSQELNNKFEAKIIQGLDKVMNIIQQLLNNDLDINKDDMIDKELNTSFIEFIKKNQQKLAETLESEINKNIQKSLEPNDQLLNDILEKKVDICFSTMMGEKHQQLHLRLEEQVNKTLEEILDKKKQLLNLSSADKTLDNTEDQESRHPLDHQKVSKITVDTEKKIDELNSKIKTLEEKLGCMEKSNPTTGLNGRYVNWDEKHAWLQRSSFVSVPDVLDKLNQIANMSIKSSSQRKEIIKLLNSWKIIRVNSTTRFPVDNTYIYLPSSFSGLYTILADEEKCFHSDYKKTISEAIVGKREPDSYQYRSANYNTRSNCQQFIDHIDILKIKIDLPEGSTRITWNTGTETILTGIPKYNVVTFENKYELNWSN